MHLIGVKAENGWLQSRWNLTYPTSWDSITRGISAVYDFFDRPEILVSGLLVNVLDSNGILKIEESRNMTVRGLCKIIKVPLSITFYNQLAAVDVTVAQTTEEFVGADYEKFNHSLCQFLDSLELKMR